MADTHSFSSESGKSTTFLYHEARSIIKQHVNATAEDILVTTGTGMTAVLNKLVHILDLKTKSTKDPDLDRGYEAIGAKTYDKKSDSIKLPFNQISHPPFFLVKA